MKLKLQSDNRQNISSGGINSGSKPFFQARLTINNPNDQYEQEADAVADKVMRMESPFIQAKPIPVSVVQRKCAHCKEEEKKMQRKERNTGDTSIENGLENYVDKLGGGGRSLPAEVRNFYEPRFRYDFSNVKIHTDSVAAKSAESINALAYTTGNNIVFNEGQYAPQTNSGGKLLAHELMHTVQNNTSPGNKSIHRQNIDAGLAPPPQTAPHGICGPDITQQVGNAVSATVANFFGWNDAIKDAACVSLHDPFLAASSWDIFEINRFQNDWIHQLYRPACAVTGSSSPPCGHSVEVFPGCHYSGSVNYVIFGHMCKLCYDHYMRRRDARAQYFTASEMISLIRLYKYFSDNFSASVNWARAGYGAWTPNSGNTPAGDRSNCWPQCNTAYRGGPFEVHWGPRRFT